VPVAHRKRLDAHARRQSILAAAVPMFASLGYDQTRMADVAARVGVTEPVIFQNFGTKAELFAAVLEHVSHDAATYLGTLAEEHASVLDWLQALLAADHLDRLHGAPMLGVLFADAHRLHFDVSVHASLHRSIAGAADAIASILRRGQVDGSIRTDAAPATLAWLVVSLIQARQFRRLQGAEASTPLEHDLLHHTLQALRPAPHTLAGIAEPPAQA
jgi:AcrR family transcriptional regulator